MMLYSVDNLINVIRFVIGLTLIIIAFRAFLRTKVPAMLYLTMGFTLISVGNLFSALYYNDNMRMDNILSDIFDILGLILLIIAVKKS